MTEEQARGMLKVTCERFPAFASGITDQLIADWLGWFAPLDAHIADEAMREHAKRTQSAFPNYSAFHTIYTELARRSSEAPTVPTISMEQMRTELRDLHPNIRSQCAAYPRGQNCVYCAEHPIHLDDNAVDEWDDWFVVATHSAATNLGAFHHSDALKRREQQGKVSA